MGANLESIDRQLLSHPGASKALHEKWGWMVYWVGSRQFACEPTASPGAKAPYAGHSQIGKESQGNKRRLGSFRKIDLASGATMVTQPHLHL